MQKAYLILHVKIENFPMFFDYSSLYVHLNYLFAYDEFKPE